VSGRAARVRPRRGAPLTPSGEIGGRPPIPVNCFSQEIFTTARRDVRHPPTCELRTAGVQAILRSARGHRLLELGPDRVVRRSRSEACSVRVVPPKAWLSGRRDRWRKCRSAGASRWQGATGENTGHLRARSNAQWDCDPAVVPGHSPPVVEVPLGALRVLAGSRPLARELNRCGEVHRPVACDGARRQTSSYSICSRKRIQSRIPACAPRPRALCRVTSVAVYGVNGVPRLRRTWRACLHISNESPRVSGIRDQAGPVAARHELNADHLSGLLACFAHVDTVLSPSTLRSTIPRMYCWRHNRARVFVAASLDARQGHACQMQAEPLEPAFDTREAFSRPR
jgi:hypothetical protein